MVGAAPGPERLAVMYGTTILAFYQKILKKIICSPVCDVEQENMLVQQQQHSSTDGSL